MKKEKRITNLPSHFLIPTFCFPHGYFELRLRFMLCLREKNCVLRFMLLWKLIALELKIPFGSIPRHIRYFSRATQTGTTGILPVTGDDV